MAMAAPVPAVGEIVYIAGPGLNSVATPNRAERLSGRHWFRKTAKGTLQRSLAEASFT